MQAQADSMRSVNVIDVEMADYTSAELYELVRTLLGPTGDRTVIDWRKRLARCVDPELSPYFDGLREAGRPPYVRRYDLADVRLLLIFGYFVKRYRNYDVAIDYLAEVLQDHAEILSLSMQEMIDELRKRYEPDRPRDSE